MSRWILSARAVSILPIQAGRVPVANASGQITGAYAYYVDDNGMKAQLVTSRQEVRNDSTAGSKGGPFGSGVLPGTYPLGILHRMSGIDGVDEVHRLLSTNSLPLVGVSQPVAKSKFFSYTTSSQGVLSDVKNGGLKKDLTLAFENSAVFGRVFPTNQPNRYLLIDPQKRTSAPDLTSGGYINWSIFRDYYNLKQHLVTINGTPSLAPHFIEKTGLIGGNPTPFGKGMLGPHTMGQNPPSTLANHPYKQYSLSIPPSSAGGGNPNNYAFNPIHPVLSALHQNAWVSQVPAASGQPAKIRTHVQMFSAHYNPYNVGLNMAGNVNSAPSAGPRMIKYPQVVFTVGNFIDRQNGLHPKLQTHTQANVFLEPGRSHVIGFRNETAYGQEFDGGGGNVERYSQAVGQIIGQSVFREHNAGPVSGAAAVPVTIEFAFSQAAMMHGVDEDPNNKEISQVFFTPFAYDTIPEFEPFVGNGGEDNLTSARRPGKKFTRSLTAGQLNENSAVSMGMYLRTTREETSPLRPLIDANIRAVWNNPRWDSPLDLPILAAYSADLQGEAPDRRMHMTTGTQQRGFAYLGNDHMAAGGNDRVILFDIPRRDLVSLGQLQHASAGRFSYEPTYIVGNSYANLRIPLGDWKASIIDTFSTKHGLTERIPGSFNLYDASYLVNETMFDSYIFTTIPQMRNNYPLTGSDEPPVNAAHYNALISGDALLPNPRFIPYEPKGAQFEMSAMRITGTATTGSFFSNAGHLLVDGAFNVNSTSVDAWEAFLSGTHNLPVQRINTNGVVTGFTTPAGVRFPRASSHLGDGMKSNLIDDNYWTGFRELTQEEVRQIAVAIVDQIRQRGPFLTLGQFVNRKLENSELGKSGALQAALDATVNRGLNPEYELPTDPSKPEFSNLPANSTQGAGYPGQILQGDVLQALAPYMTVRSDTFTIRSYGEARDSNNRVTARAWCEAVVQRLPDPFSPSSSGNILNEIALPSSPFGRQFAVLSFRWLNQEEV